MRRIEPEFRAAVIKASPLVGPQLRSAAATDALSMPRDTRALTRGVKSRLRWDQAVGGKAQPLSFSDRLELSEEAKNRGGGGQRSAERDLDQASATLDDILSEMKRRGLASHPRTQALMRLKQSIQKERQEVREASGGWQTLFLEAQDLWSTLMQMVQGPGPKANRRLSLFKEARELQDQGDVKGASRKLRQLLASDPEDTEASARLGRLYLDSGNTELAGPHMEKVAAARPQSAEAQLALGEYHYKQGEPQQALVAFSKALRLAPEHSDANAWIGILAHEGNRPVEAQRFLERAIAFDPNHSVARFYLAQVSLANGDKLRADYQLDIVRKLEPTADLSRFDSAQPALAASRSRNAYSGWVLPRA